MHACLSKALFLDLFAGRQKPQAAEQNHGRIRQNDPHGAIPRSKPAITQAPGGQDANHNVAEVGPLFTSARCTARGGKGAYGILWSRIWMLVAYPTSRPVSAGLWALSDGLRHAHAVAIVERLSPTFVSRLRPMLRKRQRE
jgi:hypothetical protein